ncbi:hypothetical protein N2152v2_010514 [Parachlorella kessleri]
MQQPESGSDQQGGAKAMFLRIIRGLTGSEEEDEQYQTASDGEGSPDTGHLTARSSGSGGATSRPQSAAPSQPQSSRSTLGADAAEEGQGRGWGGVLGGVPFLPGIPTLLQALSPKQTEDDDEQEPAAKDEQQQQQQHQKEGHKQQQVAGGPGPPELRRRSSSYPGAQPQDNGAAEAQPDELALLAPTTLPALLEPGNHPLPTLSEPSSLMGEDHLRALAASVPTRHRQARWRLLYSTLRDGISLHTLLRAGRGKAPTMLVVRDMGKYVFGSFCSEPWRLSNRYYGTGETFVFQLEPRQVAWYWWWRKMGVQRNDFFMWGRQEGIAVGGAGGYALWLDEELSRGISRTSATFGNDSLSSKEEFLIGAVELWWLS